MRKSGKDALISVIIPCWNGAAYVGEAIESVLKQGMNTEIIVIDDGSTDKSRETAAKFPCTLVPIPHSGIAKAGNTGIAHAQGEYLMFLDQDDVLCAGSLSSLLEAFLQDGALQAVAAKALDFISPELDGEARKKLVPRALPYHGLMTGSLLLRADVPASIGPFNESLRAGQAMEYMLRIEQSGIGYAKLDRVSVMRRLHANNTGRTMRRAQFTDYGTVLRAKLAGGVGNG
jgi:glycosyltransferase involved in cell wall biosynthesis